MRNLWVFLFKNRTFVWFLIFQLIAFFLIFRFNPYQGGLYLNNTNRIIGGIYLQRSKIESYLNLKTTNEALAFENSQLRAQLKSSQISPNLGNIKVVDSINHQQYIFTPAHIVNNTTTRRDNYLTLDKGSSDGVQNGMGVIFSKGVLGVVKDVSPHFCIVLSILHSASRVSVRIKHSKNLGSMYWDGVNSQILSIRDVPSYVEIKKGDTIETSGFSFFPQGIPIGTITDTGTKNGEGSLILTMKLLGDLNKLDLVYIVKDKYLVEKLNLETSAEK